MICCTRGLFKKILEFYSYVYNFFQVCNFTIRACFFSKYVPSQLITSNVVFRRGIRHDWKGKFAKNGLTCGPEKHVPGLFLEVGRVRSVNREERISKEARLNNKVVGPKKMIKTKFGEFSNGPHYLHFTFGGDFFFFFGNGYIPNNFSYYERVARKLVVYEKISQNYQYWIHSEALAISNTRCKK